MNFSQLKKIAKKTKTKIDPKALNNKMVINAIKKNGDDIKYIPKEYHNRTVIIDSVIYNPLNIKHIKQSEMIQLKAVNAMPEVLIECVNPSYAVIKKAVSLNGLMIEYVDFDNLKLPENKISELCRTALKNNIESFKYMPDYMKEKLKGNVLSKYPEGILYLKDFNKIDVNKVFSQNPKLLFKMDSDLFSKAIDMVYKKELNKINNVDFKARTYMKLFYINDYIELFLISLFLCILGKIGYEVMHLF